MERTGLLAAVRVATKLALVLFALAGLYHVVFFLLSFFAESRPPIIVKGGSIHFQSVDDPTNGSVKHKKWAKESKGRYKPDHPKGKAVSSYTVWVVDSSGSKTLCGDAPSVDVTYTGDGADQKFYFEIALSNSGKLEPMLVSPGDVLKPDDDYTLGYGTTRTGSVSVVVGTQPPCSPGTYEIRAH
jgi:hypothetical protein